MVEFHPRRLVCAHEANPEDPWPLVAKMPVVSVGWGRRCAISSYIEQDLGSSTGWIGIRQIVIWEAVE